MSLIIEPAAEADIVEAWAYYDERGHGDEFRARLGDVFRIIAALPLAHRILYRDVRRALLRDFPYAVFYSIDAAKPRVFVLAVLHQARDPAAWP